MDILITKQEINYYENLEKFLSECDNLAQSLLLIFQIRLFNRGIMLFLLHCANIYTDRISL